VHPVHQNISGHSEVCGDIGVSPAVYDSVLQQPAVVVSQIQEEGAKSIRCSLHSGDLGGQDDTVSRSSTGPPCPLVLPVLLFVSSRFRPPTYPGIRPSPRERPGNARTGYLLDHGARFRGGWGIPWTPVWLGVGIIGRRSPEGMWDYLLSLLRREGNGGVDEGARQSEGCWTLGPVNRHTLITELAESGAGDEVIMSIAGHVSAAMLSRYSHVRMEAKRRALEGIAARQSAARRRATVSPRLRRFTVAPLLSFWK
jgi:hypothetical protein